MTLARYAIFGQPVSRSLSPYIHAAFARQSGIAMEYTAIEAGAAEFPQVLEHFAAAGGQGGNVTMPLKEIAFALCTELTQRARRAGAVNTLVRNDGQWLGDNTDGAGLVRDLTERQSLDLRGRRTLLLGAGGAARGVAPALLDAGITELIIVNRTPERADALADVLGEPGRAHSRYWEDLGELGDFELIVNATAAARAGGSAEFDLPFSLSNDRSAAVDLNYGEAAITFLAWARAADCRDCVDGLGMLVEQAAESFALSHGVRPDTHPVYTALRQRHDSLVTAD